MQCKKLAKATFSDPGVQQALGETLLLQADVTANDEADQALLKKFELFGPPAVLFFNDKGQELNRSRLIGFLDADEFADHVRQALTQ